jgi:hypothetical protein
MIQPLLYIITDHSLDFSDKEKCVDFIKNQDIQLELEQYLSYVSHLTNTEPEEVQQVQIKQIGKEEIWLFVNDINIKIRKHIVQLHFPFIFRSFFDYAPLRKAIEVLLVKWFVPAGADEYAAYPSFWQQSFTEVRNPQHEKRLAVLQDKICHHCVSYKRTKLNLELCLSHAVEIPEKMKDKKYKGWFVGEF